MIVFFLFIIIVSASKNPPHCKNNEVVWSDRSQSRGYL